MSRLRRRRRRQEEAGAAKDPPRAALERRLTWLWSTPRSGAALLLELLAYPLRPDPNTSLGFRPPPARATIAPEVIPIDELSFAAHFAPWPGDTIEVHERWVPGTVLNLREGLPSYLLAKESAPVWEPLLRDFVLGRIGAAGERASRHVPALGSAGPIVIKETFTTHGADRVMGLLPRSRALVLVRDPRDVVASRLPQNDPGDEDRDLRRRRIEETAKLWAMSVDVSSAALDGHRDEFSLTTRLEDLLASPVTELGRILEWIELERTPEATAEAVERSTIGGTPPDRGLAENDLETPPGAWREELSDEERATVEVIAGPRLVALGYPVEQE